MRQTITANKTKTIRHNIVAKWVHAVGRSSMTRRKGLPNKFTKNAPKACNGNENFKCSEGHTIAS
eukprot:227291-Amphidinium_carterae.4